MAKNWNKAKSPWDAAKQHNNSLKETKQQESQQADIPVYQKTKTPFNNKYLDNMYANTVKRLGGLGVKNTTGLDPLKDAYEAVSLFKNVSVESGKMNWDLAPDTKDPMGVGMNEYEKRMKQLEYRYMTNGVNDYAGLKAIYDAQGFKTKSQWEQDNLDRAMAMATKGMDQAELARMQAAGEQDDMLARWMEDNPTMKTARENPALNKAMGDFYTNIDQYLQLVLHKGYEALPEDIREAYDQTNFVNDRRWNENTPQEEWDALNAWGDEMAREYRDAAAIYQPYEVTDGYQTYLDEKMRATPEGAQMWLDEAMGTEEEQAAKDNLWFVERKAKYDAIPQAVDFEEKSQAMVKDTGLLSSESDRKYAYINNQGNVRDEVDLAFSMTSADNPWYIYTMMEPHEVKKYDYLMREEGEKAAEEYLEYLTYDLDARANKKAAEQTYALAMENGWNAAVLSVASVPMSLARGINYVDVLGQSLFNGDKPVNYERTAGMGVFADAARQGTMDSVNWNVKILGQDRDVFDFLYGTAMSGLDSVAASAMGPVGGPLVLGSSAAQSTMQNALNNGASQGQAVLMGSAAGAFESVFEALSIGKFLKTAKATDLDNPLKWLKNLGVQALTNASEEFNTSVANFLVEQAIMGEKSEMAKKYQYYLDMGLSEKEANAKVAEELAWQFGEDALGGALMGVGMGGISDAAGAVNTRNNDKRVGKAIIAGETEAQILEKAKAFGPDSLSAKSAQKYEKKKTPAGLGKVFRDTLATMDQRGRRELYDLTFSQVKRALNADGEIANVDAVATAIVDLYAGNRLDADEMQALAESKKGMDVAQELLGMDTLTMTALEDAGKAEKKGAVPVGELPKAVQAPEGDAQTETQEAEQEAQEAPEMPAQQSVEVTNADGSTTEIAGIREDDDGQAVIETADGNEIDLEDAGLTESQQQIANEARGTEYAAQTLGAYNEAESMTTNARDFSRGFNRVAAAAANGKTLEEATQGIYAGKISKAAQQAAYAAGQNSRAQTTAQQSSATYKAAQRDGFRMLTADIGSKAGLYYANVTGKVTDAAKTMMRVIGRFAEEAGIQIQVFDTQGKANGAYTQGTNVIRIALDADQGALTKVASHEVYHYIKDWNSDGADRLAKKVFDYLEKADGYNLDQRVQEKIQEYARANVTLSEDDAKEEIVADALLDFIGTEENFRNLMIEDSKMADKIRAWVQQMMARIRSILETMAASNPEVRVLKDNEAYFAEIAAMMDGILEETREIMESTKKGESARIKNDQAVKEYREDMRTAKDESERQSALNGLMAEAFARTQKEWLKEHPDADMDSAIAEFREALSAYGRGEKFVQKALEDAGFISPTPGSNEMALLSFAGQQAAMMQERGEKYDLKADSVVETQERGTEEDAKLLLSEIRKLGRISINELSSDGIKLLEKWAKKFYKNLGTKSPFFRAWFGDWRANDNNTRIQYVPVNSDFADITDIPRGNFINADTNWNISVKRDGIDETANKKKRDSDEFRALADIDSMIQNAVLLDTVIVSEPSKRMSENAVFVHNLYCPVLANGKKAIAKLYIVENYDGDHKFYLTKIEKVLSAMVSSSQTGKLDPRANGTSDNTEISVAELFEFVKKNDVKFESDSKHPVYFKPKESSKVVNADGTPKIVYHGSKVRDIDVFKTSNQWGYGGMYLTDRKEIAEGFTKGWGSKEPGRVYELYARIENPLIIDAMGKRYDEIAIPESFPKDQLFGGKTVDTQQLANWARELGRDGLIVENVMEYDLLGTDYIVFSPNQVKSATDNVGTFDPGNTNIKFSLKESPTAPVEEGLKEDAELYTQMRQSAEGKAALKILQKLYGMATRGDTYLMAGEKEALIEKGAWQKRMPEIMEKIRAETGSEINERKLRSDLAAIFNAMDRGEDVSDMLLAAKDLGRDILAEAPGMMNPIDPSVKEAMRILKDSRFYLTDEMKSEIRNTQYGSVAAYMRKNFGKMGIRAKAKDGKGGARKSLAEVWMELSEILPGTFQADATEADMPGIVDAWLETAGQRDFGGAYGQNIGAYSTDLGLSILLEYFNLPGAIAKESDLRTQYEKAMLEMRTAERTKYEERIKTKKEREELKKAKEKAEKEIMRDARYLLGLITKDSNTKHVPEILKKPVIKAMIAFKENTDPLSGDLLQELAEEYAALGENGELEETEAARAYDEDILENVKAMAKAIDKRRLSQLTLEELLTVQDVMANIRHMVMDVNSMIVNGRTVEAERKGMQGITEMAGKEATKHEKLLATIFKNTTPAYFFKRMGGVLEELWNDFRGGQDKWAKWMKAARKFADKTIEDYGMAKWLNGKETLRFTTQRGEIIELNRQLALSLYATWKREMTNTWQKANHLFIGGFQYPQGMKPYEGVDMKKPHRIGSIDMMHIREFLGKDAMEFADKMVGYLSNDMSRIGNEVTMQLYGYRKFKEKYYFPYQSSSDFLSQDLTKGDIALEDASGALKNWGAAKKLQKRANNAIKIGEFMDVWAGHVNKMCIYGAFTIPADNMNRIYNFKPPVDSDSEATSFKHELSRVYGDGAGKYIATLIRDISGGVRAQDRTSVGKMISKFKKGSVAGNLQVVVQQPSAIARVMAVMNPKYLLESTVRTPGTVRSDIEEMRRYSGIAIIKEMGRFDTGTGASAVEWLQESVQEGKFIKRNMERLDKITGWGAEKADLITWQHIWHAVKKEVEANAPELEAGSREYFEAVRQRFDEIIDYTQVYDSVLAKSELMRSNSTFDKMTTSFMAEPTVTYNMLQDAIMNVKEMGGKKKLLRATSVWVTATAFNAMLKSLVSAIRRKDDEERTYIEKYIAEVWGNFSGDMDPISLIPIGRDIASLLEGYDVERADMAIYAQMVDAWDILWNDNKSFMDKIQAVTGAAGNMLGIPAKNIWRDAEALLNAFMANPDGGTDWRLIKYSVLDETPAILGQIQIWDDKATAYYNRMARALDAGDVDKYTEFKEYMTGKENKTEQTIKTEVIKQIKEMYLDGEMDRESAEKILTEHFEMSEKDAYFQVEEWIANEADPDASYSRMGEWIEAVESGTDLAKVWQKYKKLGYDKGDLSSAITKEYKPQYIELMKTNPTAAANMKAKLLTALSAIGYDRQEKAKQIDNWLK